MNSYRIPEGTRLIILDAHDTFLKRDLSRDPKLPFADPKEKEQLTWFLREGFINFLDYFSSVRQLMVVISSDGGKQYLLETCRRFGILNQLKAVYGSNHMDPSTGLKRVGMILDELDAAPQEALFIGDSRIDRLSAEKAGVPFLAVPDTLEDRSFSFNQFLPVDFAQGSLGLELQKIENPGPLYHNLSTPRLVELALSLGQGKLAHLGPLVVPQPPEPAAAVPQYVLREPSSEEVIHWDAGWFRPFEVERFEMLYLRLLAFLQDRPLFVQDCFAGADAKRRVPLRLITQTAWHNLFARHLFIQAKPREMAGFFPEFTLIHVPHFKAIPSIDGTEGPAFVLINLLKKTVLIGGSQDPGLIQNAVFSLLSYLLPKEDVVPLRCSSFVGPSKRPTLVFGPASLERTDFAAQQPERFLGDDCHGWAAEGIYNIEWGCHLPLAGIIDHPRLYRTCRQFAVLLQGVELDENRHVNYRNASAGARASFPITHLGAVERSGLAQQPERVVIFAPSNGALPPVMELSPELAVLLLLAGFQAGEKGPLYDPFYSGYPLLFKPVEHALRLWEKIRQGGARCWWIDPQAPQDLDPFKTAERTDPFWGQPAQGTCQEEPAKALQTHLRDLLTQHRSRLDQDFTAPLPDWAQIGPSNGLSNKTAS